MGLIQTSRQSDGGGGGGLTIMGYQVDTFEQTANFVSGGVVLALSQIPVAVNSITIDYNGQTLLFGQGWSYAVNSITILFDDPFVTTRGEPSWFQVQYPR